jgi:acyl-CoA hydrolase
MVTVEEIRKKNLPANLYNIYSKKLTSADEAVKRIKSGDNIVIQPGCAVPLELVRAMVRRKDELENVTIYHILIVGELPYVNPGMEKHFKHKAFFTGAMHAKLCRRGEPNSFRFSFLRFRFFLKEILYL